MHIKPFVFIGFFYFLGLFAPANALEMSSLKIQTENNEIAFDIEIADTPEIMQRGLMFRTNLADDYGMLFVWPKEQLRSMWMKNTPSALDMLFIDEEGTVLHIATHTTPHSTKTINSLFPIKSVLEVKAGIVSKHNIKIGDKVIHEIFSTNHR